MRSRFVHARNQQTNTVGSFTVDLCRCLSAVTNLGNNPFERYGSTVSHLRCERLLFHEVGEDAGVGCEAGECDAKVRVYTDDLFLVGGEFFCISLQRDGELAVSRRAFEIADKGEADTLSATSTVCVLLAIPTTTEPCFTASDAYSTWKMRPCGELRRKLAELIKW